MSAGMRLPRACACRASKSYTDIFVPCSNAFRISADLPADRSNVGRPCWDSMSAQMQVRSCRSSTQTMTEELSSADAMQLAIVLGTKISLATACSRSIRPNTQSLAVCIGRPS
jgi:hypothetical protein